MAKTKETTALATIDRADTELAVTSQQAMAQKEIEAAIIVAQRFPRNEEACRSRVIASCERHAFAALAVYGFPRGGTMIKGPSVNLAREAARCWGNIRYGVDVVNDDDESRTIRAWAWDCETNTRRSLDATFKKLIFRKKGGWQKPDERDLRELTNKHGETAVRNCLLHLLPPDLVDDALSACEATMRKDASANPGQARKRLVDAFRTIGVTVDDIEAHLGHPVRQLTPDEVTKLRAAWKSISDGNSTWSEYAKPKKPKGDDKKPGATMDDLTGPAADSGPTKEDLEKEFADSAAADQKKQKE